MGLHSRLAPPRRPVERDERKGGHQYGQPLLDGAQADI